MSRQPPPEALVFDVDGTLAETEEAHRRAFNETFAEAGLPWSWDRPLYARLLEVTGGKERIRHFIDAVGAGPRLDAAAIADLHARKTVRYARLVATGEVTLRPGVARLLGEAQAAGVRLAIATTTSAPNVTSLLEATLGPGALDRFDVVAAGDIVPAKKPAPDIYLLALDRLSLVPERCLAVEDSRNGLLSSFAAGIPDPGHGQRLHGRPELPGCPRRSGPPGRARPAVPHARRSRPAGTRGRPRDASGVARRRVSSARKNVSAARQHAEPGSG